MILTIFFVAVSIHFSLGSQLVFKIGLILKKGDETHLTTLDNSFNNLKRTTIQPQLYTLELLKEVVEEENTYEYQKAVCRLLNNGIHFLIAPASSSSSYILTAYSSKLQLPLITPEAVDIPEEYSSLYTFAIQPSIARDVLIMIRHYNWKSIVYLYDFDNGIERLQNIFRLGYQSIPFHLIGLAKVDSPEKANNYLRKLDESRKYEEIHVVLDMDSNLARSIILRHVHDANIRKRNFHFMLSKPTLERFWTLNMAEFGAVNVTGFLALSPEQDAVKSYKEDWTWQPSVEYTGERLSFNLSSYYYQDIAAVIFTAVNNLIGSSDIRRLSAITPNEPINCLEVSSQSVVNNMLADYTKNIKLNGVTGTIQYDDQAAFTFRKGFVSTIIKTTHDGYRVIGTSSYGQLHITGSRLVETPEKLPLTSNGDEIRITTKISPPYMMIKAGLNESTHLDNEQFEGYCKDLIDLLAKELNVNYKLKLVEDNQYGLFIESEGKWNGMIGELIQGKADLAVADLFISGKRQKVVDFTDPFGMLSFSIIMKNPHSVVSSSIFFFLNAFSLNIWICIFVSVVLISLLFHGITKYTGAPDSIESVSGIWGRKLTIILNVWFIFGSSTLQDTGVYPRSISSRILTGIWWFCTLVLSCMFIASMTAQLQMDSKGEVNSPQLAQLKDLSIETIMAESLERGWPKIGIVQRGMAQKFIANSNISHFKRYAAFLKNNPDVRVDSNEEGIKRVQKSKGDYMFLTESLSSEYAVRRKPCDLVSTHDASYYYSGFGIAMKQLSPLRKDINIALNVIQRRGQLGQLHRKWWIDSNECKRATGPNKRHGTLLLFSGLFCILTIGFLILLVIFAIQFSRKSHRKESRRQQLSFEDMVLGQSLPLPPPELLSDPPPVLNLPEYDKRTLL